MKIIVISILSIFFSLILADHHILANGYIAYSKLTDGYWQIYIRDIETGKEAQLTFSKTDKRKPVWWQPQKKLVFKTNLGAIDSVKIHGGAERAFLPNLKDISTPVFSPDFKKMIYAKYRFDPVDDSDLWQVNVDGSDKTLLTGGPGTQYDASWSPDGKQVVYVSRETKGVHNIYVIDLATGEKRRLTENQNYNVSPAWSPDGKKIVYSSNVGGSYDIWLMNSDGESQKRLTTSPGLEINPTWSPDGKLIAFTRFNNNRLEIWTVDPGTGQVKPLIQEETDCRDPVWF